MRRDPLQRFVRSVYFVSRLCGAFAAGLIALAVLVVCQMVFVRYALNSNTIWQTDFVTYSLIAATFVGSPYVMLLRGHVNVDVLPHYLRGRGRFALAGRERERGDGGAQGKDAWHAGLLLRGTPESTPSRWMKLL